MIVLVVAFFGIMQLSFLSYIVFFTVGG